jgi:SnoaL-like domain
MTIEELLALEEIRLLRAAYTAHLDSQDLDRLADLFTEDAVCAYPAEYGGDWVGRETIRANFAGIMPAIGQQFDAIHVTTNPWIELTGPDTAHGRWYLLDWLTRQKAGTADMVTRGGHDNPLLYLGVYEDEYRRVDGAWKFSRIALHTLWPDRAYTALHHGR